MPPVYLPAAAKAYWKAKIVAGYLPAGDLRRDLSLPRFLGSELPPKVPSALVNLTAPPFAICVWNFVIFS